MMVMANRMDTAATSGQKKTKPAMPTAADGQGRATSWRSTRSRGVRATSSTRQTIRLRTTVNRTLLTTSETPPQNGHASQW